MVCDTLPVVGTLCTLCTLCSSPHPSSWPQVMGVLDAMPSSNLKPENEGEWLSWLGGISLTAQASLEPFRAASAVGELSNAGFACFLCCR